MGSVETLRRAAALMRERAEAATPSRWTYCGSGWGKGSNAYYASDDLRSTLSVDSTDDATALPDAEHIASWHAAVTLAVADWLDHEADRIEHPEQVDVMPGEVRRSLAVARTYLGESA